MKRHTSQNDKQRLGQYWTTAADMLLESFTRDVAGRSVLDPFAGGGDLLRWASKHGAVNTIGYDIDPNTEYAIRDSLLDAPTDGNFILTNPPYLSRNKAKGAYADIYDMYDQSDLYKCFLSSITHKEGIVIVPSNFLSESNSKARDDFFSRYRMRRAEYWTVPVFNDASTGILVFSFERRRFGDFENRLLIRVRPENTFVPTSLSIEYKYLPGEEFFDYINTRPPLDVDKGTEEKHPNTQLVLGLLDRGKHPQGLSLRTDSTPILSNGKAFTTVQLWIENGERLTIDEQAEMVERFNARLSRYRRQYCSLFLPNYMGADQKILPLSYCYKLLSSSMPEETYKKLSV